MKRKILYVILIIAVELFKPTDLNALGTAEVGTSSSPYISLTQSEYQDLLQYKFIYQYEQNYTVDGQATSLRDANDMIEARDRAIDQKNSELSDKIEQITQQKSEIEALKKSLNRDWHWSVGAAFNQDQSQLGFNVDMGLGYKNYMPYLGFSWKTETGWGYTVGFRYYH